LEHRNEEIPTPPYAGLRSALLEQAEALREDGQVAAAQRLEAAVERWWSDQLGWDAYVIELLRLHHDINNALVGVSGNAQLLMRDPVAQQPGVRERLDVVMRESGRIQAAAARVRGLKSALEGVGRESRAA
jgi:nitrogen-specific signal transduction histidine kinase